ncbi:MAG: hypothetical protein ACK4TK_09560 [Thiobacillaceae bacterium]
MRRTAKGRPPGGGPDAPVAALLIRFARAARALCEAARAMGAAWPAVQRLTRPGNPTLRRVDRVVVAAQAFATTVS